jgi:hypothetical protein
MDTRISARDCYERGRTLRQSKLYRQALEDFQRATHDPYYTGQAHTQIGFCLRAMGSHDDAITALRYALNSPSLSLEEAACSLSLSGQPRSSRPFGRGIGGIQRYSARGPSLLRRRRENQTLVRGGPHLSCSGVAGSLMQ